MTEQVAATSNSISFVVPVEKEEYTGIDANKSPRVARKLESSWEDVRNFRESLSSEDLAAKLDAAAQRKKDVVDGRAAKAAHFVAKVKSAAAESLEQEQRRTTESSERLNQKLHVAQGHRDEQERLLLQRLHEHAQVVETRRTNTGTNSDTGASTEQRLEAAEIRRLELLQEEKERLAAREKHAQEVRSRKQAQQDQQQPTPSSE